ncbi:hypothetical protein [Bdellovibrio bacteriovorus]|uniref:hypothetical protein n=1 Tax=Bdellovibrio bacteriovorus TaxID=959 RepID=UPI0035A702FD
MPQTLKRLELWFLKFLFFLSGCWFCFFLQSQFKVSAVIAASFTGLLGTFIPDSKRIEGTHIHATIYIGAFVAMGSKVVDAGLKEILFVSIIGSLIYSFVSPYLRGLGGRLGFIAFVASLMGVALRFWK